MRLVIQDIKTTAVFGGTDYLKDSDPNTLLKEYLRVRPIGYQHSTAYRGRQVKEGESKGRWDGWKYLVNSRNEFLTGFLPMVAKLFAEEGYSIVVEDMRKGSSPNYPPIEDFTDMLHNGWQLYGLQYDAVKKLLFNSLEIGGQTISFPRGIIDAATNAGKTSIVASLYYNMTSGSLLFTLHRTKLFAQQYEFFKGLFGNDVGRVDSRHMEIDKPFVIAMYQTLLSRAEKSVDVKTRLAQFNVLVVDETHTAGSGAYAEILSYVTAPVRAFISGTPLEAKDKVKSMAIVGLSGPTLVKITNKQLIDLNISQKPYVKMYLVENERMVDPRSLLLGYSYEVEQSMYAQQVLDMVYSICEERKDSQVILTFTLREHGRMLQKLLTPIYGEGNVGMVHGETSNADVVKFANFELNVLLASSVLKEGINIPNIRTLVRLHGGDSKIDIKQFIGRALRDDKENTTVELIDFYFLGKNVSKHSRSRLRLYRKEGFNVELMYDAKRDKPIKYPKF